MELRFHLGKANEKKNTQVKCIGINKTGKKYKEC